MNYQLIVNGTEDEINNVMKVDSLLGALRDVMAIK